jgi:hypothetical protein
MTVSIHRPFHSEDIFEWWKIHVILHKNRAEVVGPACKTKPASLPYLRGRFECCFPHPQRSHGMSFLSKSSSEIRGSHLPCAVVFLLGSKFESGARHSFGPYDQPLEAQECDGGTLRFGGAGAPPVSVLPETEPNESRRGSYTITTTLSFWSL